MAILRNIRVNAHRGVEASYSHSDMLLVWDKHHNRSQRAWLRGYHETLHDKLDMHPYDFLCARYRLLLFCLSHPSSWTFYDGHGTQVEGSTTDRAGRSRLSAQRNQGQSWPENSNPPYITSAMSMVDYRQFPWVYGNRYTPLSLRFSWHDNANRCHVSK